MADFQRTFIFDKSLSGDARILWPPPGFANKDAMRDLADVIDVLGARFAAQPLSAGGATPPTFRDRVIKFLTDRNWPNGSSVPRAFTQAGHEGTVHLVEMAVICDRMLEALNAGGSGGGGGSPWPPHIR